jgi:hypothetical protein
MSDTGNGEWLDRMLILLPGFLTLGLARYVGTIDEGGDFELTLYSLALSLLVYVLANALASSWRWLVRKVGRSRTQSQKTATRAPAVVVLTVAVLLGVGLGWASESDILLRAIRGMPAGYHVTKRSSERPLTFLLSSIRAGTLEEGRPGTLKRREAWLEVTLEGGERSRRIAGYPEFFSMQSERGEVYLSPACVEAGGTWKPHEGPGLLFRDETAQLVALIDRETHPCPRLWSDIASQSPPSPPPPAPPTR